MDAECINAATEVAREIVVLIRSWAVFDKGEVVTLFRPGMITPDWPHSAVDAMARLAEFRDRYDSDAMEFIFASNIDAPRDIPRNHFSGNLRTVHEWTAAAAWFAGNEKFAGCEDYVQQVLARWCGQTVEPAFHDRLTDENHKALARLPVVLQPANNERNAIELSDTEGQILTVLADATNPLNGEPLAAEVRERFGKPWGEFNSNFKSTLSGLFKSGLAHNSGRGKAATGYTITDAGRDALNAVATPVE